MAETTEPLMVIEETKKLLLDLINKTYMLIRLDDSKPFKHQEWFHREAIILQDQGIVFIPTVRILDSESLTLEEARKKLVP